MDGFAIRMSVITQRDLADFFEHWEYPMSSSAAAAIRGYGFEIGCPRAGDLDLSLQSSMTVLCTSSAHEDVL